MTRIEDPRIWIYRDSYHYPQLYGAKHPCRPSTEYIRADLAGDQSALNAETMREQAMIIKHLTFKLRHLLMKIESGLPIDDSQIERAKELIK